MLKVSPLVTVSSLPIVHSAWRDFAVWLAERLVAGLFGIVFPHPPLPLCILVVGSCYSLACLQAHFICQLFFHSFILMVFINIIIIIIIIIAIIILL